jgi:stage III sporulation protein AF
LDFITEWITNIILFVLLATVIDMLLPNSKMQKYAKMVTGLLLIAIIVTPIFKLISTDFETTMAMLPEWKVHQDAEMKNLIESKKKEIESSQQAYILQTMAVQMEKEAKEELMNQYGAKIAKIDLLLNEGNRESFPENLEKVIVKIEKPDSKIEAVEVVEPIEIHKDEPLPSKQLNEHGELAELLSEKWNIAEETIEIEMVEGGTTDRNG